LPAPGGLLMNGIQWFCCGEFSLSHPFAQRYKLRQSLKEGIASDRLAPLGLWNLMRTGHVVSHMTAEPHGMKRVIMSVVPAFQALRNAAIGTATVDALNYPMIGL
jgi:hypothetical protein